MSKVKEVQRAQHHVPDLLKATHATTAANANEYLPNADAEKAPKPSWARQSIPNFPQLSEFEVVRHFTKLSQLNHSIDGGMYPLGSCTMKYNPRINEEVAAMPRFSHMHPYLPQQNVQGTLEVMYLLQQALMDITGMKGCSLHPAAGAQGELAGVKMIRKYHDEKGQTQKKVILVPDSAHGTNPATAALSGFSVKTLNSNADGIITLDEIKDKMDETVAGLMITVPNTLGIFEKEIKEIAGFLHAHDALLYCDGANLNAMVGQVHILNMGVDVMHINLHKTFSTPHGGGGPGSGPVVVSDRLLPYMPNPQVIKKQDGTYALADVEKSIGKYRGFYGNFGMFIRALCYIYAFGRNKLSDISETAVLNANYIKHHLRDFYDLPYTSRTLHEAVFSDKLQQKQNKVKTMDIAKRLMDFGYHPPTVYFPLVVDGALMIEPTESESKAELDRFIATMQQIAQEAKEDPDKVKTAPHRTGIKRLDETLAARKPVLTWNPDEV
ncbi:MAG: aminomethyl-transferring glycine dehydrogenase subunit GcvPB [Deltaproteobacteria bacterium]|nr:aminomethyl-transferring glycine dehydrogenase subunit GcvPB [Deltaproteobacteria bacterium]